ncbi:hypothetical protein Cpir12675_000630 [Ceratocystis pirilliformis]|uniref:Protein bir1 n=1 Tax=Ceratocystis pirilliformis TaxID=259994 RepID=A0ABR3ZKF1_9PEZI
MICHEDFVTYDARLASFTNPKKRATTSNGRAGKIMRWPHGSIRPEDMAAAGMFFYPATTNPDHTICFHCGKGLDGWENGDNPFDEHLTHSRSCGWAILKAVEFGVDSYDQLDPMDPGLVEARRETFAGLWPHEDKKGWKCKTKQLVDSGWVYTPTLESNDMATCLHCSLALDGWEPGDKPINEHESRSASCPVILALKRSKKSRTKNSTLGNTSLLSLQSNATYMSEQPSMNIAAEPEDSVMTTTSTTSKKPTRAKKSTTTTKGRKAKAKKEESAEPEPTDAEQDNQLEPEPEPVLVLLPAPTPAPAPAPAPRKRAAMNKRTSEAMEDSAMTEAEAPAPKKNTRGRAASPAATSLTDDINLLQVKPPTKKSGNRKAAPRQSTRSSRERESSNASFMSATSTTQTQSMLEDIPDDEEIDKQLEADLERFIDHEDISADSDSERRSRPRVESYQPVQTAQVQKVKNPVRDAPSSYAMFDPSPTVSEQDVEAEMKAMEVEVRASRAKKTEVKPRNELEPEYETEPGPGPEPELQPELQPVPPKKGRKAAASRKVSKTKSVKDTLEPTSEADPCSAVVPMEEQVLPERPAITLNIHQDEDELAGSTNGTSATVIKKTTTVSAPSKKSKAKQTNKQKPISDTTDEGRNELENRPVQIKVASKTSVVTPTAVTEKTVDDTPSPPPPHVSLKIKSKVKQAKEPEPEAEHETRHEPERFLESQERLELEVEEPEELSQPIQGEATSPSRPATASSIPRPLPQSPRRTQAQTQQANTQTQTKAQTQPHLTSSPIALRSSPRLRHAIALSPSQSPQASDAENKPPLSISGVLNLPLKKVVLAPPAENVGASAMALDTSASEATPHLGHYESHVTLIPMGSPGKRTVMTNIRTVSAPWASIDVDQLFDDFSAGAHSSNTTGKDAEQKEREGGDAALAETAIASSAAWIDLLQADQLSASEKDMTVEQWIHHNAAMAEKKMRQECEAMVSRFESEGSKAMRVLEGLVTE